MIDLRLVHRRKDRKADEPLPLRRGDRAVTGPPPEHLLVVRMKVKRSPVDGRSNSEMTQRTDELAAIDGQLLQSQLDRKQVPRVDSIGRVRWQLDLLDIPEQFDIAARNLLAPPPHVFGAGELVNADRGGEVGEVVLESGRDDLVIPAPFARV